MRNSDKNQIISGSSLEGMDVRTPSDENIGDIKDIMIDIQSGKISYLVLSVNTGFLNLENKYFAVPLSAFTFKFRDDYTNKNVLVLDVTKERLENSPGFDKDNWPTNPDSEFVDSVNSYYGMEENRENSKFDDSDFSDSSLDDSGQENMIRENRRL